MICAPSDHSDQPRHPPSLISIFTVGMKKAWFLSYPLSAQRRFCSNWADAQADLSFRWAQRPFCLFLSWGGSCIVLWNWIVITYCAAASWTWLVSIIMLISRLIFSFEVMQRSMHSPTEHQFCVCGGGRGSGGHIYIWREKNDDSTLGSRLRLSRGLCFTVLEADLDSPHPPQQPPLFLDGNC